MGTGYGLIEPGSGGVAVLDTGVIATGAALPLETRIHRIHDEMRRLLEKHAPAVLVLEDLYTEYRFPRTALLMAHARGVICLAASECDVRVLALAPAEVKRAVAANGAASKHQMQHSVQRLLKLGSLPAPSHVADALALALTGFSRLGGRLT